MTIDEAIAREREMAEIHRNAIVPKEDYHNMPWIDKNNEASMRCAEEHEQLAEWLEDYKRIKMIIPIEQALKAEYNKAIDDLMEKVSECFISDADWRYLVQESEQLKEGVLND